MPDSELGGVEEGVNVPQRGDVQLLLKRPVGISGTDGAGRAFLEDAMEGSPRSQKSRLEATVQRRKQQEQTARQMSLESQRPREFTTCSAGI